MKKKFNILLSVTLLLSLFSFSAKAQLAEEVKKKTPELPGQMMIDFGFNLVKNKSAEMPFNQFRSKSLGIYFVKPFDVGKSISFRPGIGLSLEKFGHIENTAFMSYQNDGTGAVFLTYDTIAGDKVKKNQMIISSLEIPLGIRFNFNGNEKKDGFFLDIGGSAAFRLESKTKLKYTDEFGEKRKDKIKSDFNHTNIRFGVYGKLGYRSISLFYKIYFTDMFTSSGPAGTQDMRYSTVGVSITGF